MLCRKFELIPIEIGLFKATPKFEKCPYITIINYC